jgi:hypothetical protein
MKVYLGKDKKRADEYLTTTHDTVGDLCKRVGRTDHKLYMDNFFSSSDLFDDLIMKKIVATGQSDKITRVSQKPYAA